MCPVAEERHLAQVLLKKTKEQLSPMRTLEGEKEWSGKQRCDPVLKARNIKAEDILKHHRRCVCVSMKAAMKQYMEKVDQLVSGFPLGWNLGFWVESWKSETMGQLEKL